MTDDEIIAVVQAHKEGKRVQYKYKPTEDSDYEWFDAVHTQIWFFDKYDYRVAPEPRKPREWWVPLKDGKVCIPSREDELVLVREVLE